MPIHVMAFLQEYESFDPALGVRLRLDGPHLRIGRASDCHLRLPDVDVSRHHARLVRRGGGYVLIDDGSASGTWAGDDASARPLRRLAPHESYPLAGLTTTRFGPFRVLLDPHAPEPPDPAHAGRAFTVELLVRSLHARGKYSFPTVYVLDGPDLGTWRDLRPLRGMPLLFGRSRDADLRLRDGRTSRRHFEVLSERNVWVRDVGSSGGTMLGRARLEPLVPARWAYGTLLYAGRNVFAYEHPITEELEALGRVGPDSPGENDRDLPSEGPEYPAGWRGEHDERPLESAIRPRARDPRNAPRAPEDDLRRWGRAGARGRPHAPARRRHA